MNTTNLSAFFDLVTADLFDLSDYHSELPERQWTDYAEITFLLLMLAVGAPLNLLSLRRSFRVRLRSTTRKRNIVSGGRETGNFTSASRLTLLHTTRGSGSLRGRNTTLSQFKTLQVHLTVANLMIICVYGLSQICWLITIEWHGGDFGCRLVKFLHTFCFYATSNMVAMIALDRLCVSIYIDRQNQRSKAIRCLRCAIVIAWLLACGSSLPQAFFWRAYAPFQDYPSWHQCVTVWVASRHEASLEPPDRYPIAEGPLHHVYDTNGTGGLRPVGPEETFYEDLYGGVHLALVFWFPALIVVCSYGVIVAKFHTRIRQTSRETVRRRQCNRENEAAQFRQRIISLHKTDSLSEDMASCTQETTISSCPSKQEPKEAPRGEEPSMRLLGLPLMIHSQALALRRRSRDVAINTLTRAKRTTLRKTMWILLAYVVCWSPYNVLELWRYFDTTFENSYLEFLSNLIVLNAVLNPLIYSL